MGHRCIGARVNGSIVPLSYRLQVGDRVEILTQKSASPSRSWLTMVKTPSARSKIRSYFSKVSRSDDLQLGRDKLTREMRKHGLGISSAQSMRAIKSVADAMGFNDPDDMFVQLERARKTPSMWRTVCSRSSWIRARRRLRSPTWALSASSTGIMAPMLTSVKRPKRHETHAANGIVVKGVDDVLVRLSKCCNPVPGDEILGFVTRGRGVSVHRADCANAIELKKEPERIIDVSWEGTPSASSYQVGVYIEGVDRTNLLLDVTRVFSETGTNVLSCSTNTHHDGMVEMRFSSRYPTWLRLIGSSRASRSLKGFSTRIAWCRGRRFASGSACVAGGVGICLRRGRAEMPAAQAAGLCALGRCCEVNGVCSFALHRGRGRWERTVETCTKCKVCA